MKMDKNSVGFVVLIIMLVVASVISLGLFQRERTSHDKLDINKFPMVVGDWKGRDLGLTEKEYDILETRNIISREYTNPSGEKLSLLVIYSETNRSVFHPPEACLLGSGITMVDKEIENIGPDKKSFSANKLSLEKNGQKEITLYSYKAGKLYTSNYYLQQFYLALHQIFSKSVPGATVRVSMGVAGDEKITTATLKKFLADAARIVDSLTK